MVGRDSLPPPHGKNPHKDRQTVQNVNEKYTSSPSAATANTHTHRPSNCSTSNKGRCSYTGRCGWCVVYTERTYQVRNNIKVTETGVPFNAKMAPQRYMTTVYRFITNIILQISSLYEFCPGFTNPNDNFHLL